MSDSSNSSKNQLIRASMWSALTILVVIFFGPIFFNGDMYSYTIPIIGRLGAYIIKLAAKMVNLYSTSCGIDSCWSTGQTYYAAALVLGFIVFILVYFAPRYSQITTSHKFLGIATMLIGAIVSISVIFALIEESNNQENLSIFLVIFIVYFLLIFISGYLLMNKGTIGPAITVLAGILFSILLAPNWLVIICLFLVICILLFIVKQYKIFQASYSTK